MRKIRVLIVDDAVVVRRIVSDVLSGDPEIEVAGIAANGKIALSRIAQVNPDIVTLDVEMPEMNGLEALAEIRKLYPKLPVIMFSTLTERGASATLDALALGASDYVTKPANVGSVNIAMQRIRDELIPKIKAFCGHLAAGLRDTRPPPAEAAWPLQKAVAPRLFTEKIVTAPLTRGRIDILAIGVSTGGPNALSDLLPTLPGNLPVPIVIVQHMPPYFTKLLAGRLNEKSAISVAEGQMGDLLQPGKALLAPGDYHMLLEKTGNEVRIKTNQGPQENSCRPAVDPLFRTVAKVYGANSLAVVLTGMGQDGLIGCEHIKEAGGQIVVQDETTSVVWGMPGYVAKAGMAEKVLPLNQIGTEIVSRVQEGRLTWTAA
jgi:two-component system chemotaxis response regulator CheB